MKIGLKTSAVLIPVFIYLTISCFDLYHAWTTDPFNKTGFWAFCVWLIPAIILIFDIKIRSDEANINQIVLSISIIFCMIGSLGDLNVLQHVAFSLAVASISKNKLTLILTLIASICWMPVLGWVGNNYLALNLDWIRIPIAVIVSLLIIQISKNKS